MVTAAPFATFVEYCPSTSEASVLYAPGSPLKEHGQQSSRCFFRCSHFFSFTFFFLLLACFKCRDTKSKGAQLSSLHHDSSEFLFLLFSVLLGPIRTQTLVDISCLPRITSKVLFFCRVGLRRAVEGWGGGVRKWATVTLSLDTNVVKSGTGGEDAPPSVWGFQRQKLASSAPL